MGGLRHEEVDGRRLVASDYIEGEVLLAVGRIVGGVQVDRDPPDTPVGQAGRGGGQGPRRRECG
jgi:hypothetical protein